MKTESFAATAVRWCCAAGSAGALVAAGDLAWFVGTAPPAGRLSDPLQLGKLAVLACLFVALAGCLGVAAWRESSMQRAVITGWSTAFVLTWAAIPGFLLLVYYPLPPHKHHLDKLLLIIGLVLVWSVVLVVRPRWMERAVNGRWYGWLRVGLVNLLLFIMVGEGLARLADPLLGRYGLFSANRTPTSLKPYQEVSGSIGHSNSQGFRDRERTVSRNGSVPRVVVLGDSFVWGIGVSYDTLFATLLERSFQRDSPGAEVINLGVPGFEPEHYYHLLRQYGIALHPDVVVLSLFIGNDIMRRRGADEEGTIIVAGQSFYVHRNGNWVHDHLGGDRWYLYHDLNYLLRVGGARPDRFWNALKRRSVDAPLPSIRTHPGYLRDIDERSEVFLVDDTPVFVSHWTHAKATLDALQRFLMERGVALLVVLIPDQIQLDQELRRDYFAATGTVPERYDFDKPQRLLRAWCTEHRVTFVDLLPVFRHEAARRLYLPDDPHWSQTGHALAASMILPVLQRQIANAHKPDVRKQAGAS